MSPVGAARVVQVKSTIVGEERVLVKVFGCAAVILAVAMGGTAYGQGRGCGGGGMRPSMSGGGGMTYGQQLQQYSQMRAYQSQQAQLQQAQMQQMLAQQQQLQAQWLQQQQLLAQQQQQRGKQQQVLLRGN